MTHFSRNSRTTEDTSRPSAAAFSRAAVHRVSSMRMFRSVVPFGMSVAHPVEFEDEFVGAVELVAGGVGVVHDGLAVVHRCGAAGADFVQGHGVVFAFKVGESGFDAGDGVAVRHAHSVPTRVPTRKGLA